MALHRQGQLIRGNTGSIVGHLHQAAPSRGDFHTHRSCPGIQGVFQQLFHHGSRAFNYFPGGNLRGDFRRQDSDGHACIIYRL